MPAIGYLGTTAECSRSLYLATTVRSSNPANAARAMEAHPGAPQRRRRGARPETGHRRRRCFRRTFPTGDRAGTRPSGGRRVSLGSARTRALPPPRGAFPRRPTARVAAGVSRSEEHTSELQSRLHLVCRLLLEKKNT